MLEQLKERYLRYDEEATLVRKKASPADGLFGFGNDPKNHPCHELFYEDIGKWTKAFLETRPDAADALTAARFVLIWLSKKMTQTRILYTFFAIMLCGFAMMPFVRNLGEAMAAMVLAGFGLSATYPVVLGQLGARFNKLSGTAFGIAISIALAGSSVINAFVGGLLLDFYPYVMIAAVVMMGVLYSIGSKKK